MREMKDSGVEWIGEIPQEWSLRRLRFLCNITTGNMDTQDNDPEGQYPFYVRSPIVEHSNNYTFDNEAVLMAGDGVGAGKVFHYVNGKYGCHQRVYSMSDFNEVVGKYLYYYLQENFYKKIEESNAKSTVDSVRLPMLKDFPVVFPDVYQQKEIVSYLNSKCANIDEVIKKQQTIIEKLKEYKLSIITEKVSNGLNPCVSTKYSGNEFIGSIPSHWKCVKIKNVSIVVTDGAHVSPETENGVYDFISTVNVEQDHIDFDNCLKTTESSYQYLVSTGCRPLSGDVLISKDGSVGRTAIVNTDRDFVVSSSLVIIRPNIEMITSEYLNFILQSAFVQETLLMLMHGAGLRRVSVNKNANLPVLLPPIEEQKDIVKYLEKKCSDIEKDITKRRTIVEELFMYKKSIIFEAVTGKKEI